MHAGLSTNVCVRVHAFKRPAVIGAETVGSEQQKHDPRNCSDSKKREEADKHGWAVTCRGPARAHMQARTSLERREGLIGQGRNVKQVWRAGGRCAREQQKSIKLNHLMTFKM